MTGSRAFKTIFLALPLAAFAAALPLRAQGFEGTIDMHMAFGQTQPTDIKYSVKNGVIRMEMSTMMGPVVMLNDPANHTSTTIIASQQMYMETSTQGAESAAQRGPSAGEIKATGRTETIAGYSCEHYLATGSDGKEVDLCVAKGLGVFMMGSSPMGGRGRGGAGAPEWAQKLGADFFPLKVTQAGTTMLEVVNIEKKPLDDSMFKVPDGYRKMTMPGGRPPLP